MADHHYLQICAALKQNKNSVTEDQACLKRSQVRGAFC